MESDRDEAEKHMMRTPLFVVDPSLSSDKYMIAKTEEYRRAIRYWNECDSSTRKRITVDSVLLHETDIKSVSEHSSGAQPISGSQPISCSQLILVHVSYTQLTLPTNYSV